MKIVPNRPPLGPVLRQQFEAYGRKSGQGDLQQPAGREKFLRALDRALLAFAESLEARLAFIGALLHIENYRGADGRADPTLQSLPKELPKLFRRFAWDRQHVWAKEFAEEDLARFKENLRAEFPVNASGQYDLVRMRRNGIGFFGINIELKLYGSSLSGPELGQLHGMQKLDAFCDGNEIFYTVTGFSGGRKLSIQLDFTREYEHRAEIFPVTVRSHPESAARRQSDVYAQTTENRGLVSPPPPAAKKKEKPSRPRHLRSVK